MEEFTRYVKATLVKLIGFTCLVLAVLVLLGQWQYISGWCVGCLLNILYFFMLCSRSLRAVRQDPVKAFSLLRGGAFLRILMIILMLIVVLQFPSINIWAVLAGILMYRLLIYFDVVYRFIRIRRHS